MSYQAMRYVLEESRARRPGFTVLLVLAYHVNQNAAGQCWLGYRTLERECRIRRRNIRSCLDYLVSLGELEILETGSGRKATTYRLKRFCELYDVGETTGRTPLEKGLQIHPNGMEKVDFRPNSGDTVLAGTSRVRKVYPAGCGRGTPQGAEGVPRSNVPQGAEGVPREGAEGVPRNRSTLTGTGSAPSEKSASGAPPGTRRRDFSSAPPNGWHARYYELLSSGKSPAEAAADLRAAGLLPEGLEASGPGAAEPARESRRGALKTLAEIFAHVRGAKEGKEPYDFVDPQPQIVKTNGGTE
jgi:hypothetical protein